MVASASHKRCRHGAPERLRDGRVIAFVLVRVRAAELDHRLVEGIVRPEVGRNRHAIARAGVGAGEGPSAQTGVDVQRRQRHRVDVGRELPVPELPEVVITLHAVDPDHARPPEHDVARRLDQPLSFDDSLPVVGEPAAAGMWLQHGVLGLLHLQEERVGVVAAEEQRDPAPRADAADAHDLAGEVDQPIALEQTAAVGLGRASVDADLVLEPSAHLVQVAATEQVGEGHDDRRIGLDPVRAVDAFRELVERLHVALGLRLGQVPLEPPHLAGSCSRAEFGEHLLHVEACVPHVEIGHPREVDHRLAIFLRDPGDEVARLLRRERTGAPGDLEARREPFDVPLERTGARLVEVVDVEEGRTVGCREAAEVRQVRVAAGLDAEPGVGRRREVCRHDHRGTPIERERRGEHPFVAERDEIRDACGLLRGQERGGVGTTGTGRPLRVCRARGSRPRRSTVPGALVEIEVRDGRTGAVRRFVLCDGHAPILPHLGLRCRHRPGAASHPGRIASDPVTVGTAKGGAEPDVVPSRAPVLLITLILVAAVANLNLAVANVALPDIGKAFDSSQTTLDLIAVGYSLGLAASVVYLGALGDRYGRKLMLILGVGLSIPACMLAAWAPTDEVLVLARLIGGLSAGMAFPTTLALITALWSGQPRVRAIALWSAVGGGISALGPLTAGWLLGHFWWGSVFLVTLPLAVVALVMALRFIPAHVNETSDPVDNLGGVLSIVMVAGLVLAINFAPVPDKGTVALGLAAIALAALIAFVVRQRQARFPLYDLDVARRRIFWVAALAGIIVFGSLMGAMFVGQQFLQNVLDYSTLEAGTSIIPAAVMMVLIAPRSAKLVESHGARFTLLVGYVFVFLGFLTMLLLWKEGSAYWQVALAYALVGTGVGFAGTPASHSLTGAVPIRRVGMASATADLQRDLGGAIMQSILGALLTAGYAASFATLIAGSPNASSVSTSVQSELTKSFSSAANTAAQYPQYSKQIIAAAQTSFIDGADWAYVAGLVAIVLGAAIVFFLFPKHDAELGFLARYHSEDADGDAVAA